MTEKKEITMNSDGWMTRGGHDVKILTITAKGDYPVFYQDLVDNNVRTTTLEGCSGSTECLNDLIPKPKPKVVIERTICFCKSFSKYSAIVRPIDSKNGDYRIPLRFEIDEESGKVDVTTLKSGD